MSAQGRQRRGGTGEATRMGCSRMSEMVVGPPERNRNREHSVPPPDCSRKSPPDRGRRTDRKFHRSDECGNRSPGKRSPRAAQALLTRVVSMHRNARIACSNRGNILSKPSTILVFPTEPNLLRFINAHTTDRRVEMAGAVASPLDIRAPRGSILLSVCRERRNAPASGCPEKSNRERIPTGIFRKNRKSILPEEKRWSTEFQNSGLPRDGDIEYVWQYSTSRNAACCRDASGESQLRSGDSGMLPAADLMMSCWWQSGDAGADSRSPSLR